MGVYNSADIFQENISKLFYVFDMVHAYIDEVLIISIKIKDHLKALYGILQIFTKVGLKVNAEKSLFEKTETKYIGFWVSNNGVRPLLS